MGTIREKPLKSGRVSYTAQIVRRKFGYNEARSFDSLKKAERWLKKREAELDAEIERGRKPITRAQKATNLGEAIDKYIDANRRPIGRTKEQVLRTIKDYDIASIPCERIAASDIVKFAQDLSAREGLSSPATIGNYLGHLSSVFRVVRPMFGIQLNEQEMRDAQVVCKQMGITSKALQRDRRPTMEELDTLMTLFQRRSMHRPNSCPMHVVVAFALFSTRRQSEVTRITWEDYDQADARIVVRDMKHPGDKAGNDVMVELPDPCAAIVSAQPTRAGRIFPYTADAITAAFTRACKTLGIHDLHFHDLRHEGTSRLAEMGRTIPQLAAVTGHRSWSSLERYTHVRKIGDRYEDWSWIEKVT